MAQITWQNVNAPNLTGELAAYAQMGNGLSNAFDRLGNVFVKRNTDAKAKYADELLGQVMLAQDPAALDAMRAGIAGNNAWQLAGQKAAIGEALTRQTGVLQDQSIKREGILDSEADRTYGGQILANRLGIINGTEKGIRAELQNVRTIGKYGDDFATATDTNFDNVLDRDQFGEVKANNQRVDSRARQGLALQARAVNDAANARAEARAKEARLEATWQQGYGNALGHAGKGGAADAVGTMRRGALFTRDQKMSRDETRVYLEGLRQAIPSVLNPDTGADIDPTIKTSSKIVDDLARGYRSDYTAIKTAPSTMVKGDPLFAKLGLGAYGGSFDNFTPAQALAAYKGKNKDEFKAVLDRGVKMGVAPGLIVAKANNVMDTGVGAWDLFGGELSDTDIGSVESLRELQAAGPAIAKHVEDQRRMQAEIQAFDTAAARVKAQFNLDTQAYGTPTVDTMKEMKSLEAMRDDIAARAAALPENNFKARPRTEILKPWSK